MRQARWAAAVAGLLVVAACGGGSDDDDLVFDDPTATDAPSVSSSSTGTVTAASAPDSAVASAELDVAIDASARGEEISPLILGVSSTLTRDELADAGLHVNSWGGNPATRYNYVIGNAWNNGADYEFRNTNFGDSGPSARNYVVSNAEAGVETRLAVPTLGWVARNDDQNTCSFPTADGQCLGPQAVGNCENPSTQADPETANTPSTPESVADWVGAMVADGLDIRFIAMDNEPELWGHTHFDVHPDCPTYEEILDTYLAYASALRAVAPDAELTGPVMCCWYDYWRIAPGPADGPDQDFLEWFLTGVRQHDEAAGERTIDVVDVHYYPQSGVFNDETDPETNARRLRSTRSLWDPDYVDESWINDRIAFIPRMKQTIERAYPGLPLFISEWNFGADTDINGALAIAEVLGVYGREGVYAAAYWRNPPVDSPGWQAFKMHGNYDGAGSRFGGRVVPALSAEPNRVSSYAAIDEATGVLRVMLVNKDPEDAVTTRLDITGFESAGDARRFTYGPADLTGILADTVDASGVLTLDASTITLVELEPAA